MEKTYTSSFHRCMGCLDFNQKALVFHMIPFCVQPSLPISGWPPQKKEQHPLPPATAVERTKKPSPWFLPYEKFLNPSKARENVNTS